MRLCVVVLAYVASRICVFDGAMLYTGVCIWCTLLCVVVYCILLHDDVRMRIMLL